MYTMIGLHPQAVATLRRAEQLGRRRLPSVQLAMGRALIASGLAGQAQEYLADVPPGAPHYAAAQVLLLCIEWVTYHRRVTV